MIKGIVIFVSIILLGGLFFLVKSSFSQAPPGDSAEYDRSNILVGEFPEKSDFEALKAHGVKRVLSLLDSKDSGEIPDNQREKMMASNNAMQFRNVPMTATLSCSLDPKYHHQARLAVLTVKEPFSKIYINATSDMRRVAEVCRFLHGWGNPTYVPAGSARSSDEQQRQARITLAFYSHHYTQALNLINQEPAPTNWMVILRGWCHYHLDELDDAKADFKSVLKETARGKQPLIGIGFTDLQMDNYDEAEASFKEVLHADKHDCEALTGMAILRYRQGRYKEARMYLHLALQSDPDEYDALALAAVMGEPVNQQTAVVTH